ncbi:MAG: CAP domain-containing protein [Sandaracinaceae bacterium]|nr:CAP domain-containing protein [Sandaracinaceae bacterium]
MRLASLICALCLAGCVGEITAERPPGAPGTPPPRVAPDDAGAGAPPGAPDASAPWGRDAGAWPPDAGASPPDAGAPAAPDAGPPAGDLTDAERDLLRAINDERASRGLAPVEVDARLMCAARRHALDVGGSRSCGHVGSDGSWPWDRAAACGFPQDSWTVNEIAAGPGFRDGADAVWGWSHSSGHYAALTHTRARTVGVAVHQTCFIALFDCCVAGSGG